MNNSLRIISLLTSVALILLLVLGNQALGGWKIPGLDIDIPIPTKIPGLSELTEKKGITVLLGCGLGGVTGAVAARALAKREAAKKHLSSSQENKLVKRYMLGFGMAGCMVGKTAAGAIYDKLSVQAKQKREETIQAAINEETAIHRSGQPVTGKPYSWEKDGANGQVKVKDLTEKSNGTVCVVVDENIEVEGETAQPLTKRCNTPPSPEWVAVGA